MLIKDILETKGSRMVTAKPEDTLADAIKTLTQNNVGSALVLDSSGKIAGIITERDVLRFCSKMTGALDSVQVKSIMTTNLIVGIPQDEVDTMIATMVENRFRHLPILDKGKLVGMVSMGDLVKSQLKEVKVENRYLKDYITGKYPA